MIRVLFEVLTCMQYFTNIVPYLKKKPHSYLVRLSNSVIVVNSESDSDSVSEMDIVEHVLEIMLIVSDLSGPSGNPARKSLQCSYSKN